MHALREYFKLKAVRLALCFLVHQVFIQQPVLAAIFPLMDMSADSRRRLLPWLEREINAGTCPGLEWLDRNKRMFKVPWVHFNKSHDLATHFQVFEAWAIFTGSYKPGEGQQTTEYPKWKRNFRCALNKMPGVEEVKELRSGRFEPTPYRVYRFVSPTRSKRKISNASKSVSEFGMKRKQEVYHDTEFDQSPIISSSSMSEDETADMTSLPLDLSSGSGKYLEHEDKDTVRSSSTTTSGTIIEGRLHPKPSEQSSSAFGSTENATDVGLSGANIPNFLNISDGSSSLENDESNRMDARSQDRQSCLESERIKAQNTLDFVRVLPLPLNPDREQTQTTLAITKMPPQHLKELIQPLDTLGDQPKASLAFLEVPHQLQEPALQRTDLHILQDPPHYTIHDQPHGSTRQDAIFSIILNTKVDAHKSGTYSTTQQNFNILTGHGAAYIGPFPGISSESLLPRHDSAGKLRREAEQSKTNISPGVQTKDTTSRETSMDTSSLPSDLASVSSGDLVLKNTSRDSFSSKLSGSDTVRSHVPQVAPTSLALPVSVSDRQDGLVIKVFYGSPQYKVLDQTIVGQSRSCRVFHGEPKLELPYFDQRMYGDRDIVQINLPDSQLLDHVSVEQKACIDAILNEMHRGLILTADNGDVFARRLCRTRAFVWDQNSTSRHLNRKSNVPEKIFDIEQFRSILEQKWNEATNPEGPGPSSVMPPFPYVFVTFGHRFALENGVMSKVMVSMTVGINWRRRWWKCSRRVWARLVSLKSFISPAWTPWINCWTCAAP